MSQQSRIYLSGYAAALADIHRMHGCTVEVVDAMREAGLTPELLRRAGADVADVTQLVLCVAEVPLAAAEDPHVFLDLGPDGLVRAVRSRD